MTGLARDERGLWHMVEDDRLIFGKVMLEIEPTFRALMCELHTLAHVINALVYTRFGGALLTGAQLNADGTFRVDFDLPGADLSGEELTVRVIPKQADEFTCSRCFLVQHRNRMALQTDKQQICSDCV